MELHEIKAKLEEELRVNNEKQEGYMENLRNALLSLTSHSVKDMSIAVLHCQDEARRIQICIDALEMK